MSLFVFHRITNTRSFFLIKYYFINTQLKEIFLLKFSCMKTLIFYNLCFGPNVIFGDLAVGLDGAIIEVVNSQRMPRMEAESL